MKTKLNIQMYRRGLYLAAVAVVMALTAPSFAQVVKPRSGPAGSWRLIGSVEAGRRADHDTLAVRGPFDDFRRIKFKVTGAPVNIDHVVVTYDNGTPDELEVRQNIPEGGESRQIDLRGAGKRSIRRLDFWYDTKGVLKGKATVTVFGMK